MTALSVNLNKVALVRNSRTGNYPSVTTFATICLAAGCDGLTVHPRPDQRHIRPHDVYDLAALLKDHPEREFNIEGNPFAAAQDDYPGLLTLVEQVRPQQCTLVPDSNNQLTSDHGFDLTRSATALEPIIEQLHSWGIRSCLFMDPDDDQIRLASELGVDRIELYTGPYAAAWGDSNTLEPLFNRYRDAALLATSLGLGVNAGHDLNLANLGRFASIPGLLEVSIGHALTVDALHLGMDSAVRAYLALLT